MTTTYRSGTFTLISSPERIHDVNRISFGMALTDTARDVARQAPRDKGDLAASIYATAYAGQLRGKVASSDIPGKVRMRQFGGTIRAKAGGYLRFRTKDGRWHSVRQVTQRPGGPSNGYRPLFEPVAEFGRHMAARIRQISQLKQYR